jgi:hypothetical protein
MADKHITRTSEPIQDGQGNDLGKRDHIGYEIKLYPPIQVVLKKDPSGKKFDFHVYEQGEGDGEKLRADRIRAIIGSYDNPADALEVAKLFQKAAERAMANMPQGSSSPVGGRK